LCFGTGYPGRCPGLSYRGLSGLRDGCNRVANAMANFDEAILNR
jgi:hypothetical protein